MEYLHQGELQLRDGGKEQRGMERQNFNTTAAGKMNVCAGVSITETADQSFQYILVWLRSLHVRGLLTFDQIMWL